MGPAGKSVLKKIICGICLLTALVSTNTYSTEASEQDYDAFKAAYQSAETSADLRSALELVQQAYEVEPTRYKYNFGIGAVYERLADFTPCEQWFDRAADLAPDEQKGEKARVHREYCQNELDKLAVRAHESTISISFSTKLSYAKRELDSSSLPSVFPDVLTTDKATLLKNIDTRLPSEFSVVDHDHLIVAAPGDQSRASEQAERVIEYDGKIRKRFFPNLEKQRLILVLGDEPHQLRRISEDLYPGAPIPNAPFFGFYHQPDRLIMATALGGYGTVLHELLHALVQDDFPGVPLWLEEGMATLFERSDWSVARLIPAPNWRMELITSEQVLEDNFFSGIGNNAEVTAEQLSSIRLLFTYLDNNDQLAELYSTVKQQGADTPLVQALETVGFDSAKWHQFVSRSFREYALENSRTSGGGLTNPGEIKFVQRALNAVMDTNLKPDGLWGSSTRTVLEDFQLRFGLEVDGVAGMNTMIALRREFGRVSLE